MHIILAWRPTSMDSLTLGSAGAADADGHAACGWVLSDSLSVRRGAATHAAAHNADSSDDDDETAEAAARRAANEAAAQGQGEGCVFTHACKPQMGVACLRSWWV